MKAFKGCINENSKMYHKKHYKNDDKFCLECGSQLYYVCADCWKQFDDNKMRYCIACDTARKTKRAQRVQAVKNVKNNTLGVVVGVGATVTTLAKNAEKIHSGAKTIAKVGKEVANVVIKR